MDLLNRTVRVVQAIAAVAAAAFVILLFVNEPQKAPALPKAGATVNVGQAIFATRCSSCHGSDGGGGFGPTLAGVVAGRYPNPADEVAVVTNGRGAMPTFSSSLTADQIAAVVEYTRSGLG
jgi:mono/diheme cytochrome c family protein